MFLTFVKILKEFGKKYGGLRPTQNMVDVIDTSVTNSTNKAQIAAPVK